MNKKKKIIDYLPVKKIPKSLLLVGSLEELVCTDIKGKKRKDAADILDSSSDPLVCASEDGKLLLIISSDAVEFVSDQPDGVDLKKATNLHTDFHGVDPPEIKKINTNNFDYLIYFGQLVHVVYNVPQYSERRGPPFIHKAGDKGDDVPPAKVKPNVCYTPSKDMIVIYGDEMRFTDRGIIG